MIGTSFKELVFIRVCILVLQYFPLVVLVGLALTLAFQGDAASTRSLPWAHFHS